jgi:hypothetical protein
MEATSLTNAKRKYLWWWDCPKNSKWLQENLEGKKHVYLELFVSCLLRCLVPSIIETKLARYS